MADFDFLEVLDAPQVTILTHGTQIEGSDTKYFNLHLRVLAIKAAKKHTK